MTEIKISVIGANAEACKRGPLTAGMVGVPVEFTFDTDWAGLNITAVFEAGEVVKDKPLDGAVTTTVPYEVLQEAGEDLRIGVEGRNAAGDLVIPTTWAKVGKILQGANSTGNPALEPTPSQYERLMSRMDQVEKDAQEVTETAGAALEESQQNAAAAAQSAENAASSKDSAAASEKNAATSEKHAKQFAEEAAKSATAAATSEKNAKESENVAVKSAEGAETSEKNAAVSEQNAAASAEEAAKSALRAKYADWNAPEGQPGHVLNRTHWTESDRVEIMPETQIVDDGGDVMAKVETTAEIVVGETYTVNFRGTPYVCTAAAYDPGFGAITVLGNLVGFGGADTGEPFLVMCLPADFFDAGDPPMIGVMPYDDLAEGTVSIYQAGEKIHKLPNKYLDLDWLPINNKKVEGTLHDEIHETVVNKTTGFFFTGNPNGKFGLVVGNTYRLTVNGVEYEDVAKVSTINGIDFVHIGNMDLITSDDATGDYLAADYLVEEQAGIITAKLEGVSGITDVSIKIQLIGDVCNKLPEEFLPESVESVILRSSTAGSTKRFKLTVDDSGTVTAAEM